MSGLKKTPPLGHLPHRATPNLAKLDAGPKKELHAEKKKPPLSRTMRGLFTSVPLPEGSSARSAKKWASPVKPGTDEAKSLSDKYQQDRTRAMLSELASQPPERGMPIGPFKIDQWREAPEFRQAPRWTAKRKRLKHAADGVRPIDHSPEDIHPGLSTQSDQNRSKKAFKTTAPALHIVEEVADQLAKSVHPQGRSRGRTHIGPTSLAEGDIMPAIGDLAKKVIDEPKPSVDPALVNEVAKLLRPKTLEDDDYATKADPSRWREMAYRLLSGIADLARHEVSTQALEILSRASLVAIKHLYPQALAGVSACAFVEPHPPGGETQLKHWSDASLIRPALAKAAKTAPTAHFLKWLSANEALCGLLAKEKPDPKSIQEHFAFKQALDRFNATRNASNARDVAKKLSAVHDRYHPTFVAAFLRERNGIDASRMRDADAEALMPFCSEPNLTLSRLGSLQLLLDELGLEGFEDDASLLHQAIAEEVNALIPDSPPPEGGPVAPHVHLRRMQDGLIKDQAIWQCVRVMEKDFAGLSSPDSRSTALASVHMKELVRMLKEPLLADMKRAKDAASRLLDLCDALFERYYAMHVKPALQGKSITDYDRHAQAFMAKRDQMTAALACSLYGKLSLTPKLPVASRTAFGAALLDEITRSKQVADPRSIDASHVKDAPAQLPLLLQGELNKAFAEVMQPHVHALVQQQAPLVPPAIQGEWEGLRKQLANLQANPTAKSADAARQSLLLLCGEFKKFHFNDGFLGHLLTHAPKLVKPALDREADGHQFEAALAALVLQSLPEHMLKTGRGLLSMALLQEMGPLLRQGKVPEDQVKAMHSLHAFLKSRPSKRKDTVKADSKIVDTSAESSESVSDLSKSFEEKESDIVELGSRSESQSQSELVRSRDDRLDSSK